MSLGSVRKQLLEKKAPTLWTEGKVAACKHMVWLQPQHRISCLQVGFDFLVLCAKKNEGSEKNKCSLEHSFLAVE